MSNLNWNALFTGLVRNEAPSLWGNWTLNSSVQPGMMGFLDATSGDFTSYGLIDSPQLTAKPYNSHWNMTTNGVTKTGSEVKISGRHDPTTNTTVEVEAEAKWSFSNSQDMMSKFQPSKKVLLQGPKISSGVQIANNMDLIKSTASANNYTQNGQITQGFGVITQVIYAEAGMNVGSASTNSSFSMSASVDGMAGMTDSDKSKASLKGSYFSENSTGTISSHLWPASSDEISSVDAPIAFKFATFVGDNLLVPLWVNRLNYFTLYFDNQHGGTYIVNVSVTGLIPGKDGMQPLGGCQVSGGSSKEVTNIPLNVTNLTATLSLESGPTFAPNWPTPLSLIPTGEAWIDIYGYSGGPPAHIKTHVVPPP